MEVEPATPAAAAAATKISKNENVIPSASGEEAAKYPDMKLAQLIHRALITTGPHAKISPQQAAAINLPADISALVLKQVVEMENPSLYTHLSPLLQWDTSTDALSTEALQTMSEKNAATIISLEEKVTDAKENQGDMEVMDARFQVARFAAKSLNKEEALGAYQKVLDLKKLSSGKQMDALMESSRIASFYGDGVANAAFVKKVS